MFVPLQWLLPLDSNYELFDLQTLKHLMTDDWTNTHYHNKLVTFQ